MSKSLETTNDIDAVDKRGWTALHRAAQGDVSEVERLLAAGANVEARTSAFVAGIGRNSTPLIIAAYYNYFDVMRLLLDRGARIDACDNEGYGNENTVYVPI